MVGLPGSSLESDLATFNQLAELKVRGLFGWCQCAPATPNPGTPFHAQAKREGWLTTDDYNQYHWYSPVVSYPHYSADRIFAMFQLYRLLRS